MERVVREAKKFIEHLGEERNYTNLLLIGKTGTGKTHISTAIAKAAIERGHEVLYDSVQNVVSAFEYDRFKSGYGAYEPRGDKYMECDLLILDDLGTEFVNQFTVSCLYNLLNTRINRGLATVISTNLSPEELSSKYEDRIYSRIQSGKMYTEKFGTYQCTLAIREMFMQKTQREINDAIIEEVLCTGTASIPAADIKIIRMIAKEYVDGIFRRLREHGYDEGTMMLYITGGGGCLVKNFGKVSADRVKFVDDICAAAKGYEYLAEAQLRAELCL